MVIRAALVFELVCVEPGPFGCVFVDVAAPVWPFWFAELAAGAPGVK